MKMIGSYWNSTIKSMQKNEYIIVCKAPQRYGGIEVISPIISEIKKILRIKAYLYFQKNSKCIEQLKKDKLLNNAVEKTFAKNINYYFSFKFIILRHFFLV